MVVGEGERLRMGWMRKAWRMRGKSLGNWLEMSCSVGGGLADVLPVNATSGP